MSMTSASEFLLKRRMRFSIHPLAARYRLTVLRLVPMSPDTAPVCRPDGSLLGTGDVHVREELPAVHDLVLIVLRALIVL